MSNIYHLLPQMGVFSLFTCCYRKNDSYKMYKLIFLKLLTSLFFNHVVVVTNEHKVTSEVLDFYVTCINNMAINALMKNLQQCMTSRFIDHHLPPSSNIATCHYWRISCEFPSSTLSKENRNGHSRKSR